MCRRVVEIILKKKQFFIAFIVLMFLHTAVFAGEPPKTMKFKPSLFWGSKLKKSDDPAEAELQNLSKIYKDVTDDEKIMRSLELMKGTLGEYSRSAILGNNLSDRPIKIEFKDLSLLNPAYANFDAVGWKKKKDLYIYINQKHSDAPEQALAALLSHEALHQDDFNSLNEETYAWTMEAAVWTQLSDRFPDECNNIHPLAVRENTLKKLFIKGNYSSKYIRKTVFSNPGYKNLPSRSPGFEDDNL